MRFLAVHPSALMYTKIFLRLEPIGVELVAQAARLAGHEVKIIDLQVASHREYFRLIETWRPDAIGVSGNYLANIPEIIDLAGASKKRLPESFFFAGGHSASFLAREILEQSEGAIDAVLRGEGEAGIAQLLSAVADGKGGLDRVPGLVTTDAVGPPPGFVEDLETRADVMLWNRDVFRYWKGLGLKYIFIGLEAIDEVGLKKFRKRVSLDQNNEALEFARSLGVRVAVNISIMTPYPGTESWLTESRKLTTRDYRLFDIQHAVLPTRLPLEKFYEELVKTQQILNKKFLGFSALRKTAGLVAGKLLHGQTNFLKMLWKFNSVYNPELQLADHQRPVKYEMNLPTHQKQADIDRKSLYIHTSDVRKRHLDRQTETFIVNSG